MQNNKYTADLILLLVAAVWGFSWLHKVWGWIIWDRLALTPDAFYWVRWY